MPMCRACSGTRLSGVIPGWVLTSSRNSPFCVVCGDEACRNQRLIDGKPARYDSPTIMVGGRESYEARCRHCHRVPSADEDQRALL